MHDVAVSGREGGSYVNNWATMALMAACQKYVIIFAGLRHTRYAREHCDQTHQHHWPNSPPCHACQLQMDIYLLVQYHLVLTNM